MPQPGGAWYPAPLQVPSAALVVVPQCPGGPFVSVGVGEDSRHPSVPVWKISPVFMKWDKDIFHRKLPFDLGHFPSPTYNPI